MVLTAPPKTFVFLSGLRDKVSLLKMTEVLVSRSGDRKPWVALTGAVINLKEVFWFWRIHIKFGKVQKALRMEKRTLAKMLDGKRCELLNLVWKAITQATDWKIALFCFLV